ncbi:MAG: multidrug ABC transporter ATP-binding protein [Oceanospirillaceae bacterium]|nr:multidrug ABC transporter ATP-binding protein [Oceanospirillaceae bacterium]
MFKFFENLAPPYPQEEPTQPPATLVAFIWHYCSGLKRYLGLMAITSASLAFLEVLVYGFMGQLVDWLAGLSRASFLAEQKHTLWMYGILLLVIMPLMLAANNLFRHQILMGNLPMRMRWQAHRYLLKQSMSFYQDDYAGRIATKVMQGALAVRDTAIKSCDTFVYVTVYLISMVAVISYTDWRMAIPMMVWLVCFVATQLFFAPRLKKISEAQANERAIMTGRVVDSYTNIATVKLFAHTKGEAEYARSAMDGFMVTVYDMMRKSTNMDMVVSILNNLLVFGTAAIGIYLWLGDTVSIGTIAVGVALALRLQGFSDWIMWEIYSLFENIGTVIDSMTTLANPHTVVDETDAALEVTKGQIEFDNVGFHYGKESGVIDNFNLTIAAGEKIGIVGRSGAGKSTMVNLLLRFHDVETGEIRIDGKNISQVSQDSLRAAIGMVTQDTSLLHRSVRENIVYGKPDASDADIAAATRKAEADSFIYDLIDPHGNKGYMAQVGERGVKLSGGQRQRIAIARVLLKDAPILVLDEATSALDSEVEASIQRALYRLMANKTVIAIAHRLSTIAAMDRLIVMDEGKIIEQGSHQELLALEGIYAKLWRHQTGGFIGFEDDI